MLPFVEARAMVRKFKLGSQDEWEEWRRSPQRPKDIPSNPSKVYKDSGFISFPDWLGYKGRQPPGLMLPFGQARDFARKLKLRSRDAWQVCVLLYDAVWCCMMMMWKMYKAVWYCMMLCAAV